MKTLAFLLTLFLAGGADAQRPRGPDRAPQPGTPIPAVSARSPDGKNSVDLSKPKRLTVLIFGSHT